jgi:methyl-accepting chemotaxis protein
MIKLGLNTKLIAGFMMMGLMLLVGGVVGLSGISYVSSYLTDFARMRLPGIYDLSVISSTQQNISMTEQSLLVPETFGNPGLRDKLLASIRNDLERAEESRKQYDALSGTDEADAIWKSFKPVWAAWLQSNQEFAGLVKEGRRDDALKALAAEDDSFGKTQKLLRDLSFINLRLAQEAGKAGIAQASWLKITALAGTVVGILIALSFGIFFSRSITRPINRVIANLTETSEQFAEAAGQIAQSSNSLAEGTSIQAAAVKETSAVTEELKSSIGKYTEVIETLKNMLGTTSNLGMEAFGMLKQAKKAMKEIKKSSEETSQIVQAIEKIAFQTGLLALSASVEAARAGDAGAGFTVVADDIRGLGNRSTDAVKNTIGLIDRTIEIVSSGNDFVGLSMKKFIDYGTGSSQIVAFTKEASEIAKKQSQGVDKINLSIAEISKSAQENAASAGEASSEAGRIITQALNVKTAVKELASVVGYAV